MSQPPPTLVVLKPGTVLNAEQRAELLARAIRIHFREKFSGLSKQDAERMARLYAQDLVRRSDECGLRHLTKDLGRHIELSSPGTDECQSLDEALSNIIEIRYSDGPSAGYKAHRAIKKTTGLIWLRFRRALGLPDIPPEGAPANAVTGPRA